MLYIGLMSGTSMDGIDAALVDVQQHTLIHGILRPYSLQVKSALAALRIYPDGHNAAYFSQLHTMIGREFAAAANELLETAGVAQEMVTAIGSHGQTICHDPFADIPYTVQLGCPHTIAALTGLTVVADFRTRDLVLGGVGAPLAPLYHHEVFGKGNIPLAVVNIGGIANVTFIESNVDVYGYDTGPGNCLLDAWAQHSLNVSYDTGGKWGATGQIIVPLLHALLADPYFALKAPKSLDKGYFSDSWLAKHLDANYNAADVQATLCALTATSVADAIIANKVLCSRVLLCGGGVHNDFLVQLLCQQLPNVSVESTVAKGISPDYLEAMMIAWLASQTMQRHALDLQNITGARKSAILGAVYFC